ncbi:MAG: arsenite methyltransferase [Ignavibacteriales bacterium]|nr:arsenite methyltransferase [Ignavibacteriales bacterium]
MATDQELKELVKEKYGEIAFQSKEQNETSCCGSGCGCGPSDFAVMAEDYTKLSGYVADADLGLGCGLPTEFAQIRSGDTVVDLGSGAGNDAFVARSIVGENGKVIGIDMTEQMIAKAKKNAEKLGFSNVEFLSGDIENIPITDNTVDVVVSNCVMNLVPNKQKAFAETYRILKSGGHFSISDIVLNGELPANVKNAAEMYAGCVAGAQQMDDYIATIKNAGFVNITVQKKREIYIPNEILVKYLSLEDALAFTKSDTGIFSITVYADKP